MSVVECVAVSLDLMLEDIGKLSFFSETVEGAETDCAVHHQSSLQPGAFCTQAAAENRWMLSCPLIVHRNDVCLLVCKHSVL